MCFVVETSFFSKGEAYSVLFIYKKKEVLKKLFKCIIIILELNIYILNYNYTNSVISVCNRISVQTTFIVWICI